MFYMNLNRVVYFFEILLALVCQRFEDSKTNEDEDDEKDLLPGK